MSQTNSILLNEVRSIVGSILETRAFNCIKNTYIQKSSSTPNVSEHGKTKSEDSQNLRLVLRKNGCSSKNIR